jgi:hypothetical protein
MKIKLLKCRCQNCPGKIVKDIKWDSDRNEVVFHLADSSDCNTKVLGAETESSQFSLTCETSDEKLKIGKLLTALIKDKKAQMKLLKNGWINPDGIFIPCLKGQHLSIVEESHLTGFEAEQKGWIKVFEHEGELQIFPIIPPTQAQIDKVFDICYVLNNIRILRKFISMYKYAL